MCLETLFVSLVLLHLEKVEAMPGHAVKSSVASFYVLMDRLARPPIQHRQPDQLLQERVWQKWQHAPTRSICTGRCQKLFITEFTLSLDCHMSVVPESVWAQGSSNSGGLYLIFSSSHLHNLLILTSSHLHIFSSSHLLILTSSHLHIFSSSHLLIFTSAHLHICSSSHLHIFSSSHLLIFTSAHLHIFTSSHLLIFTSSHLHIFSSSSHIHILSSSHLLIFTSSHLHIFSSSHLLIFTSSHLHIFSSSHLHIFTSSHLHIFTSSHLHIFSSSHLHIFSSCPLASCPLALLPSHLHIFSSCPLALLPSCPSCPLLLSISILTAGAGAVPTRRHETQPFRTKWGSIAKKLW